jgi:hypothetical protein
MFFANNKQIQIISKQENLILKQRTPFTVFVLNAVFGILLISIGGLMFYVFLISKNHPQPYGGIIQQIVGWLFVSFFGLVLGLWPLLAGLKLIFTRQAFVFQKSERCLKKKLTFGDQCIWKRTYSLNLFEKISLDFQKSGFLFHSNYVISCEGKSKKVDLVAFYNYAEAKAFSSNLAAEINLPISGLL